MSHNEEYIISLIKNLEEQVQMNSSRLGGIINIVNNSVLTFKGHGTPVGNTPGTPQRLYTDLDTGVLWEQKEDGTWSLL